MKICSKNFPKLIIEDSENEILYFAHDELLKYARFIFGEDLYFNMKNSFFIGIDSNDEKIGTEGYRINIKKDSIRVSGSSPAGALYGIYCFLKDFCGCCFAAPGINGEYIPELTKLDLPETEVTKKPILPYRGMQCIHRFQWKEIINVFDWMAKNGFNYVMYMPVAEDVRSDLKTVDPETGEIRDNGKSRYSNDEFRKFLLPEIRQRGLKLDMNHHNILANWLPPVKYFELHPDWYPLIDGKRQAKAPQLGICTSNQDGVNKIIENVKKFLRENPETEIIGIIPEDGYGGGCQCENCVKLDHPEETIPETLNHRSPEGENKPLIHRYSLLLNQVAEEISTEFPKIKIGALYYVDLQWPPRHVKLHKNILPMVAIYWRCGAHKIENNDKCEINNFFHDLVNQWSKAKPNDFILYEYYMGMNAQASLPYPMGKVIIEEWPELIKLGVQGASIQANPLNYRAYGINYLAFAAAAWNEKACYNTVFNYWLKGMFGAAAPFIKPIYEALDRALEKIVTGTDHECIKYTAPAIGHILPDASNIAYFIDELTVDFIDKCVDNARKIHTNSREKAQVEEFAAAIKYWKLAANYFHLKQLVLSNDFIGFTDVELENFKDKFEQMENYRLSIEDTGWAKMSRPLTFPTNIKNQRG